MQKVFIKLFAILIITLSTLWCSAIHAQVINVGTEAQLNTAISQYNALTSASDNLTIQLTGNITLTAPLTPINNGNISRPDLNIISSGEFLITLNGNDAHQILNIAGYSFVTIENIRFSDGRDTVGEGRGGAIFIDGDAFVTIRRSEFVNNSAPGEASAMFADSGGAIHNEGNLTVFTSTFENNVGITRGGAISTANTAKTTIVASTFVSNSVTSSFFGGAVSICSGCTGTVTQSTFSNNTISGGTANEGLENDGGNLTIGSNIFADSCDHSSFGSLINLGNNVFSDSSPDCTPVMSDVVGEDPLLIALADNGGITRTMAIPESSPAREAGRVDFINRSDQRGVSRDTLPADSGAYEFVVADQFDAKQRNDSQNDASDLSNGFFKDLSIDDVASSTDSDFYKFNLTAGKEFIAKIDFIHSQVDLDIQLTDGNGLTFASSTSTSNNEQITFTPTISGEYLLRVYVWTPANGSLFYDLTASGIDEQELCFPIKSQNDSVAVVCL